MTNLKAILKPAYEPGEGKADGDQFVDDEWWHPVFGCDSLQKVVDNVRSMLKLPPGYIDPEHQGQDRELLQAFYQACKGEGGTADEIHLRGIKAALATLQTALPEPSAPVHEAPISNNTGHANQRSFKDVNVVIDGIDYDKDDLNVGWWCTPDGSIRGRIRLRKLRDLIQRHLDKLDAQSLPGPDLKQFMAELQRIQHVATREGEGPSFDLVSAASNLCCDATTGPATEEHLITVAGTACAGAARTQPFPVDLAALHDPDFSDGLSSIEHLNRLSGVTPASPQPPAIAQPAESPTDDELLRTYGAAKRNHQYDGPSDDWPNRAERAATVYGLRAVLTRYGRPAFQPIPVSERLPGPDDCCPSPTPWPGQWCWGWVQHGRIPYSGCWRMTRRERLSAEALAWAPWWALPLPGSHSPGATEEAGEVKE
jgi:hypothetical protein